MAADGGKTSMTEEEKKLAAAADRCKEILKETGCDYVVSIFPERDGRSEISKGKLSPANLAAHLDSVANKLAGTLGVSRELVLLEMAKAGTFRESETRL